MLRKIEAYMREYHMIEEGGHIVIGVSGGADSVCLLRVLMELRERLGYTLSVLHVEHGIRGEDSLRDASFVEQICSTYGLYLRMEHYNVPEYARAEGLSEEEAGRVLRYQAFAREKALWEEKRPGAQVRIAVAHNRNDNAETMLFHLARGTGIRGLSGIPPVRDGIIRPLLWTGREEIEGYLHGLGQEYCTDRTNLEEIYARNKIRHQILPGLRQLNPKAVDHMGQTALELREINGYLEKQVREAELMCVRWEMASLEEDGTNKDLAPAIESEGRGRKQAVVLWEAYQKQERVIQSRLLYHVLEELSEEKKDITRESVLRLDQLFFRQTGRQVDLAHGIVARRVYEGIWLAAGNRHALGQLEWLWYDQEHQPGKIEEQIGQAEQIGRTEQIGQTEQIGRMNQIGRMEQMGLPQIVRIPENGKKICQGLFLFELLESDSESLKEISKKKYTKCFDYDKIKDSVCIRKRLPGDYLIVDAAGHRQKLKNYLVNEKISSMERDGLYLLAEGAHILWVVGYRISSYYKVDGQTRRILKVTFFGGHSCTVNGIVT